MVNWNVCKSKVLFPFMSMRLFIYISLFLLLLLSLIRFPCFLSNELQITTHFIVFTKSILQYPLTFHHQCHHHHHIITPHHIIASPHHIIISYHITTSTAQRGGAHSSAAVAFWTSSPIGRISPTEERLHWKFWCQKGHIATFWRSSLTYVLVNV